MQIEDDATVKNSLVQGQSRTAH